MGKLPHSVQHLPQRACQAIGRGWGLSWKVLFWACSIQQLIQQTREYIFVSQTNLSSCQGGWCFTTPRRKGLLLKPSESSSKLRHKKFRPHFPNYVTIWLISKCDKSWLIVSRLIKLDMKSLFDQWRVPVYLCKNMYCESSVEFVRMKLQRCVK